MKTKALFAAMAALSVSTLAAPATAQDLPEGMSLEQYGQLYSDASIAHTDNGDVALYQKKDRAEFGVISESAFAMAMEDQTLPIEYKAALLRGEAFAVLVGENGNSGYTVSGGGDFECGSRATLAYERCSWLSDIDWPRDTELKSNGYFKDKSTAERFAKSLIGQKVYYAVNRNTFRWTVFQASALEEPNQGFGIKLTAQDYNGGVQGPPKGALKNICFVDIVSPYRSDRCDKE